MTIGSKPVKLSIVMPCFNEKKTLAKCVDKVIEIKNKTLSLEIILVDDCSQDGSAEIAKILTKKYPEIRLIRHSINQGKGAALRTGFKAATGDLVTIQDADLELDSMDLQKIIQPILNDEADVVIG
jgi:glycosyltransferase involved in cell wall biosynthesis